MNFRKMRVGIFAKFANFGDGFVDQFRFELRKKKDTSGFPAVIKRTGVRINQKRVYERQKFHSLLVKFVEEPVWVLVGDSTQTKDASPDNRTRKMVSREKFSFCPSNSLVNIHKDN